MRARIYAHAVAWLPVVAYAALVWFLSALSMPAAPSDFPGRDKLVHVVEFAIFAWLTTRALVRSFPTRRADAWRLATIAALACAGWGFLDELHQASVPGRTSSVWDLCADVVGAIAGSFAYVVIRARRG